MAISFFQKLRLGWRGWNRRREDESKRKQEEFLRTNAGWAAPALAAATPVAKPADVQKVAPKSVDLEGLQAAYLDGSGVIAYYLDVESGEVVETRDGSSMDDARFKRVPSRKSEIDERRAFIEKLEPSAMRQELMKSVGSPAFRSVLASDRAMERAWYNFRNDRATQAIDEWLKKSGLR